MQPQSYDTDLKTIITTLSLDALARIRNPRFYKTERGFQGEFAAVVHQGMNSQALIGEQFVVEEEYQKRRIHLTRQRPDLILHLPTEVSGAIPNQNNIAVWAFKQKAHPGKARRDFENLDVMFDRLNYPIGVFINISSHLHHLNLYEGPFPERMVAFATRLEADAIFVIQASFIDGNNVEQQYEFPLA